MIDGLWTIFRQEEIMLNDTRKLLYLKLTLNSNTDLLLSETIIISGSTQEPCSIICWELYIAIIW